MEMLANSNSVILKKCFEQNKRNTKGKKDPSQLTFCNLFTQSMSCFVNLPSTSYNGARIKTISQS